MPLVVLEGLDGSGKTSQLDRLLKRFQDSGKPFIQLRDPGGTALGEAVREILLNPENQVAEVAELFGYLMSRAQLVSERIAPALAAGSVVVLDRFWYSTVAYQCFGLGLPRQQVQPAIDLAHAAVGVDCALYLQVPSAVARERRRRASNALDRIEQREAAFFERVAAGYQALVDAGALQAIDGNRDADLIAEKIWQRVERVL